jgi:hypothetical protein
MESFNFYDNMGDYAVEEQFDQYDSDDTAVTDDGINNRNSDWSMIDHKTIPTTISIDPIDNILLQKAKEEVPLVMKNIMEQL